VGTGKQQTRRLRYGELFSPADDSLDHLKNYHYPKSNRNEEDDPVHLKDMAVGDLGQVLGFEEAGRSYRKKLLAMGLTPGTEFSITRVAPMGDPMELRVRGFKLSLRKGEAAAFQVEKR